MKRRKLPTGIQNFREVREQDCYYVDKTAHVHKLVAEGKHYFLSRPRRFGKSLLVDTLKELFEGNERWFRGLAIHGRWDWATRFPVIRLSFALGRFNQPGALEADFEDQLTRLERRNALVRRYATPARRFADLIESLHERTGQRVVLLVDEYDRPITATLEDPALAAANRDFLRGVYSVAKECDGDLRLSFFTGVSKFTKVSVFSDLNNLTDITLDKRFATICGYTEEELETVFEPELAGLDRQAVREWYNGYSWHRGKERVYNPYGMLLFLQSREFKPHWFETGRPSFLTETLLERGVDPAALDGALVGEADLSVSGVGRAKPEALLFQTGYLTLVGEERGLHRLGYPNREVQCALNMNLLAALAPDVSAATECATLRQLLAAHDFAGVERLLRAFFASIPHQWHARSDMARYEGFHASVCYAHFAGAGLAVAAEESTSQGRSDMVVRHDGGVCIFEFKTDAKPGTALAQLRQKGYADKYRHLSRPLYLVGVTFSSETRNIADFEAALA